MPAREINPFTAMTRIRSQFLRTRLRLIPLSHRGWQKSTRKFRPYWRINSPRSGLRPAKWSHPGIVLSPKLSTEQIKKCSSYEQCMYTEHNLKPNMFIDQFLTRREAQLSQQMTTVTEAAQRILQSTTAWLDDSIIDHAQALIKEQFPQAAGLHATSSINLLVTPPNTKDELVQIIHLGGDHWVTISNIGCSKDMFVYDSLAPTTNPTLTSPVAAFCGRPHPPSNWYGLQCRNNRERQIVVCLLLPMPSLSVRVVTQHV